MSPVVPLSLSRPPFPRTASSLPPLQFSSARIADYFHDLRVGTEEPEQRCESRRGTCQLSKGKKPTEKFFLHWTVQ